MMTCGLNLILALLLISLGLFIVLPASVQTMPPGAPGEPIISQEAVISIPIGTDVPIFQSPDAEADEVMLENRPANLNVTIIGSDANQQWVMIQFEDSDNQPLAGWVRLSDIPLTEEDIMGLPIVEMMPSDSTGIQD